MLTTCISSKPSNGDTNMIIDFELFFLVPGKFIWLSFETAEDDEIFRLKPEADAALLDSFHGVLDLEEFPLGRPSCTISIVELLEHSKNNL